MIALLLSLSLCNVDDRSALLELARLEGQWVSTTRTLLVIQEGTATVSGADGFNGFKGRLELHPRTGRLAIVAEGEPPFVCRYTLDGDRLKLFPGGQAIDYHRYRWQTVQAQRRSR